MTRREFFKRTGLLLVSLLALHKYKGIGKAIADFIPGGPIPARLSLEEEMAELEFQTKGYFSEVNYSKRLDDKPGKTSNCLTHRNSYYLCKHQ